MLPYAGIHDWHLQRRWHPNAMNATWGGISEEMEISICADSGHKTAENLLARKAFTVSMATVPYLAACDYVGIVSGNKEPN